MSREMKPNGSVVDSLQRYMPLNKMGLIQTLSSQSIGWKIWQLPSNLISMPDSGCSEKLFSRRKRVFKPTSIICINSTKRFLLSNQPCEKKIWCFIGPVPDGPNLHKIWSEMLYG